MGATPRQATRELQACLLCRRLACYHRAPERKAAEAMEEGNAGSFIGCRYQPRTLYLVLSIICMLRRNPPCLSPLLAYMYN